MSTPDSPRPPAPQPVPSRPPLRRSRRDRVLGGVCGGLARYLDIDPVLLRIAFVALALSGGAGVLAYVVAWMAIPQVEEGEPDHVAPATIRHRTALVVGAVVIGLGVVQLARAMMPGHGSAMLWSLILVGAGALVLAAARR